MKKGREEERVQAVSRNDHACTNTIFINSISFNTSTMREAGEKRRGVPLGVKDGGAAWSENNAGAQSPQIHQSSSSSSSSPRPPLSCLSLTARTASKVHSVYSPGSTRGAELHWLQWSLNEALPESE
ncbi:hypothetical protein NQZ68_022676 [Dissostichus eleginoides]|nr:hypothetical protein NQZ68_022676 [Dissostichus eleginoides]